jgi:hypothetical protein
MKIYRLTEPRRSQAACFTFEGTWRRIVARDGLCPACTSPPDVALSPPFVIKWLPCGDRVADFVWPQGGGGGPVVRSEVGLRLTACFRGFDLADVHMVQEPHLKRPARPTKRTKPRIWLPYEGPALNYVHVTTTVHLDERRSTGHFNLDCKTCGRRVFMPVGVEEHSIEYGQYCPGAGIPITPVDRRRDPGAGVYVHKRDLGGADVFNVEEVPFAFCTEAVRECVLAQGYTNIDFWEYGEID